MIPQLFTTVSAKAAGLIIDGLRCGQVINRPGLIRKVILQDDSSILQNLNCRINDFP